MERERLKSVLKELHEAGPGDIERLKKEAGGLLANMDAHELALAEQELIQEGTPRSSMKRLCDVHLEIMKKKLGVGAKKIKLPAWHPIQISMDEHKVIKKNLKRLKTITEKIKSAGSFKKASPQIKALKELGHFFLDTEKHHKREEEALFPRLEAHGVTEPPLVFKEDHVEFLAKKRELHDLVMRAEEKDFSEFLNSLAPITEFLVKNLTDHIYKEDNILYPIALKVLAKDEWKAVRKRFDAIGYCCFAPRDYKRR